MRKKGQTEIIGLMVIVILIVVVFLLYLKFFLLVPDEGLVTGNVELSSTLNALIKYDTPQGSIKDLIVYCQRGDLVEGEDACIYLEDKINLIMEQAVEVRDWNIKVFEEKVEIYQIGEDCPGSNLVSNQNIRDQDLSYTIRLEICKKV